MKRRIRRASRILLVRGGNRVLLFRFAYTQGALAGRTYWTLPGGGLEGCETPETGAIRELQEETGIQVTSPGVIRFESEYDMTLMNGEDVRQHDYYFVVPADDAGELSRDGLTDGERSTLAESRWWTAEEILASGDEFMPPEMGELLSRILSLLE